MYKSCYLTSCSDTLLVLISDFCYLCSSVDWHRAITRSHDTNLLKILYRTLILCWHLLWLYMFIQSDASHDPKWWIMWSKSTVEQYHKMCTWLAIVYLLIETEDISYISEWPNESNCNDWFSFWQSTIQIFIYSNLHMVYWIFQ